MPRPPGILPLCGTAPAALTLAVSVTWIHRPRPPLLVLPEDLVDPACFVRGAADRETKPPRICHDALVVAAPFVGRGAVHGPLDKLLGALELLHQVLEGDADRIDVSAG